ncbi:AzlD domain-containing protein [Paraferrimonas sp. SM1919]|uniref:AzlD domain-containing protein n=1 Tax=Paraferrimonas sp. SM1919 TaxID=2662263 RepID=UPI0013D3C343|nr:AzlD domain-containing protein [Paraferrimonas sp. SM1919]
MDNLWWLLLAIAGITFGCRYFFLSPHLPFKLGPRAQRFLSFSAPCVLTAMTAPILFQSSSGNWINPLTSPYFLAGLIAIGLSLKLKNTLLVIVLAMVSFVGLKVML